MKKIVLSILIGLWGVIWGVHAEIIEWIWVEKICEITMVDDGDTFDLKCQWKTYPSVRLLWINAPDKNQKNGKEYCYYEEAKKFIVSNTKKKFITTFYGSDICKDPYKGCRNLVEMTSIENGIDLGGTMISKGYAFSWTTFSMIPTIIHNLYNQSEIIAYERNIWLWGKCDIIFWPISNINASMPSKMTN